LFLGAVRLMTKSNLVGWTTGQVGELLTVENAARVDASDARAFEA